MHNISNWQRVAGGHERTTVGEGNEWPKVTSGLQVVEEEVEAMVVERRRQPVDVVDYCS